MEKKSSIIAIGLTVHNAPVELREKLAVPEAEWPRAIAELCSFPHIEEAAVLSTCNRMEIYVVGLSFHRGEQGRREAATQMPRCAGHTHARPRPRRIRPPTAPPRPLLYPQACARLRSG